MQEIHRPVELLYIRLFLAIFGVVIFISEVKFVLSVSYFLSGAPPDSGHQLLILVGNAFAFVFGPLTYGLGSTYLIFKALNMPDQMIGVISFILWSILSVSVFVSVLFGLVGRKRWGWIMTITIIAVNLVLDFVWIATHGFSSILISVGIFLAVLCALSRGKMRRYFLAKDTDSKGAQKRV